MYFVSNQIWHSISDYPTPYEAAHKGDGWDGELGLRL